MQRDLKKIEDAGIQVIGISYDDVPVLSSFAEKRSIGFPLLSDTSSETIKKFSVLNPQTKVLPFPGTLILDENGVVRAKIFNDGYVERHSTEELITKAKAIQ